MLREKIASDIMAMANLKLAKAAEDKPKKPKATAPAATPKAPAATPKATAPAATPKAPAATPKATAPAASPMPPQQAQPANPYISMLAKLLTNRVPASGTTISGGTASPMQVTNQNYDMPMTDIAAAINPSNILLHNLGNGNI